MADSTKQTVKIWDAPTRLFHWSLVVLVVLAFITAENEGLTFTIPNTELHMWIGMSILTLVLFRIGWGFVGSATARFAHFVRGPGAILAYMTGRGPEKFIPGHNPAGAVMIVLVLALLTLQAGTGLFLEQHDDVFAFTAPLNHLVSVATADRLNKVHHLGWALIQLLILVHIVAVLFYVIVRRQNLIGAMFTGRRKVAATETVAPLTFAPAWRAVLALLLALAIVRVVLAFGHWPT